MHQVVKVYVFMMHLFQAGTCFWKVAGIIVSHVLF